MYNNKLKEQYWLIRARRGDTESFGKYYDSIVHKVYQFVFFKVSSKDEAEDITSQTFLKVWEQLQKEDSSIQNIRAFTYRIARNLIIDHYRQRARYTSIDQDSEREDLAMLKEALRDTSWKDAVDQKSDIVIVYQALEKLKDEYREIIILKHINELSTKEIGHIINKNSGAVRTQLSRSMAALREVLPESFIENNETIGKKIKASTKHSAK